MKRAHIGLYPTVAGSRPVGLGPRCVPGPGSRRVPLDKGLGSPGPGFSCVLGPWSWVSADPVIQLMQAWVLGPTAWVLVGPGSRGLGASHGILGPVVAVPAGPRLLGAQGPRSLVLGPGVLAPYTAQCTPAGTNPTGQGCFGEEQVTHMLGQSLAPHSVHLQGQIPQARAALAKKRNRLLTCCDGHAHKQQADPVEALASPGAA